MLVTSVFFLPSIWWFVFIHKPDISEQVVNILPGTQDTVGKCWSHPPWNLWSSSGCLHKEIIRQIDRSFDQCSLVPHSVLFTPSRSPTRTGHGIHGVEEMNRRGALLHTVGISGSAEWWTRLQRPKPSVSHELCRDQQLLGPPPTCSTPTAASSAHVLPV